MMRLYSRLLLPVCVALFSGSSLALDNWWHTVLSERPFNQVKEVIQKGGSWYPCDTGLGDSTEPADELCLDDFHYYSQHLYGEVVLRDGIANFLFLNEYQWQNWNDLILSLRKDGFVMQSVNFDEEEYDVLSALEQKSAEEVDKEVIVLMNRYPPDASRTMQWVRASEFNVTTPSLKVILTSDGEMIGMRVTRF
ncbi:hypothetical protein [Vibrio sp. YIC-376]|uniref:hypothetical protein n=1 Tax=Vibrio sp. YIC-376 TaxID=3136162 RepID=UPI00402AC7E9